MLCAAGLRGSLFQPDAADGGRLLHRGLRLGARGGLLHLPRGRGLLIQLGGGLPGALFRLRRAVRRTIVIEVGMQNAAQAIAVATSPLIFDSGEMAVPAIVYALVMNVVLLSYLKLLPKCTDETASDGA